MNINKFEVIINNIYWINNNIDDQKDLCAHGDVKVIIGNKTIVDTCTLSATGLYLLRSIYEDHLISEHDMMLPCCGNFLIPNDDNTKVEILGCANGHDWNVMHKNGNIEISTDVDNIVILSLEEYKDIVFEFTDIIENFYNNSSPKILSDDDFEKNGYIAFFNEWKSYKFNV